MTDWYGWAGTILDVNLTTGKIKKVPFDQDFAVKYIGGRGFGTRWLYDEVPPEVDSLSPEAVISINSGPLVGTMAPASSRIDVVARSPLTGIYGRSNSGGFWSAELKWAGYDSIIIRGAAAQPVYLWINDDVVELRDASHLWGQDTWATERTLRRELDGRDIKTLRIGPAGENLSCAAAIINDLGRAAATRGLGALLGAKKLKAIAVRGTRGVNIAEPREFAALCHELTERFKYDPMYASHTRYGTNNWVGDIVMAIIARITGQPSQRELMSDCLYKFYEKNLSCSSCPLHCSHYYHVKSGKYAGTRGEGIEGNIQLGANDMKVANTACAFAFNNRCNQLGLDGMHTSTAIAWAMQLYKEGVISREDTGGVELMPGNEAAIFQMMEQIAANQDFGKLLGAGIIAAAEAIGHGAETYVSHTKGYPYSFPGPGFMSSVKTTLAHAIATRGHDHLTGSPGIETVNRQPEMTDEILEKLGKERYNDPQFFTDIPWNYQPKYALRVRDVEDRYTICDMTGTCKFAGREVLLVEGIGIDDFARLLTAATGITFSADQVKRTAQREMVLERAYNARAGIRKIDDYPHAFRWELEHGECHPKYDRNRYRMSLDDYTLLLEEYYRIRGCDPATGIPTGTTLEKLGLKDVADDLETRNIITTARDKI
jgi:aldehyde:ferredoxin oxidoreductase